MVRKNRSITPPVVMARIVVDTRDARRDILIPLDEALRQYHNGWLVELVGVMSGIRCFEKQP